MSAAVIAAAAFLFVAPAVSAGDKPAESNQKQAEKQSILTEARRNLQLSTERSAAYKAEVQALSQDQKRLSRALAAAAGKEQSYSDEIAAGLEHLHVLAQQQQQQQKVLTARQAETAEILAGLEKLGLSPPPVIFVRTEDRRQSLQAAVLLGALLPQMRAKAEAVQADLAALEQLELAANEAQEHLRQAREKQADEHRRLALLLEEKKRAQRQKQQNLQEEEKSRKKLAEKVQNLQDLLGEISKQTASPGTGAAPGQMQIEVPFSTLRGLLPRPVAGRRLAGFGQTVGGKLSQGEIIETAPAAMVLAPAEGVVRYAGRFRSYGQLVIIDAGENYYIILAGMAQIHVAPEQFLLQGEPVGSMEKLLLADKGGFMVNKAAPQLYMEIRKDGKPVNPALWWAATRQKMRQAGQPQ
ncbi:murein hydrolase activator EnvC family protein [Candidatus Tokpelaia sp.]|uniref:murein hydrolase activator EnvC family protein n=1 Tax=Candidatus Tokpelaia sp. TaxID=2233777 RepID=UPI00123B2A4F|nr:peptidoglycan DD-metalloendopeptidase family protein [Candidatus Tokpelaia sp.]